MRVPRVRQFLSRPMRLPQWGNRGAKEGDPKIFGFNADRDSVVAEVAERVATDHVRAGDDLALVLNAAAHAEVQRLERQHDEESREWLPRWRKIMRGVSRMSEAERIDQLRTLTRAMSADIAGNFDPRVYWMAQRVVPNLIAGVINPPKAVRGALGPGRGFIDDIISAEGALAQLRHLVQLGTVVLVPTHSSNLDSLALGACLANESLPPCVYGAGKNLFTNPMISFFMHNLGAYRVDRRVKASLYKQVLKTYSTVMIERGYHSLFFPGGTRSRSGMVEHHLKLGLAGTGVEAFVRNAMRGSSRRVFFVPVTINYELVLEAESLVADHLKERGRARFIITDDEFSRLDRWVAFFNKVTGQEASVVLRFGRALDPFGNPVDDDGNSIAPHGGIVDPVSYVSRRGVPCLDASRDAAYTRELGRALVQAYDRDTVVTSTQLVGHLLFRQLVAETPGVDLFGRVRLRGEVSADREVLVEQIGLARDQLLGMEAGGDVRVSPLMRREAPANTLARALSTWGYHSKSVARELGGSVVMDDPSLVYYYANRLVDHAETLARPGFESAAREIADLRGGL